MCYPYTTGVTGTRYIAPIDSSGAYIEGNWWLSLADDFSMTTGGILNVNSTLNVTGSIVITSSSYLINLNNGVQISPVYGILFSSAIAYCTSTWFAFGWGAVIGGYPNVNVQNGAAVFTFAAYSDQRMKQDIAPSKLDCLATVKSLPLVEYRRRDIPDPAALREAHAKDGEPLNRVGMIAQQIAKLFPEGVTEGDDFDDRLGRVWGLDQNNMLALLVGAVQQLAREVEGMKHV
jgi:hypothetical protein